jgi:hypothetical protein
MNVIKIASDILDMTAESIGDVQLGMSATPAAGCCCCMSCCCCCCCCCCCGSGGSSRGSGRFAGYGYEGAGYASGDYSYDYSWNEGDENPYA